MTAPGGRKALPVGNEEPGAGGPDVAPGFATELPSAAGGEAVAVEVAIPAVCVAVAVGGAVAVEVPVAVGGAVAVLVPVAVGEAVAVEVPVAVGEAVAVEVPVAVAKTDAVGVFVAVADAGVEVLVAVREAVGV